MTLLFMTCLAFAGEGAGGGKDVGNGGHSIVCRDASGRIVSAYMYDLWEGENIRSPRIVTNRKGYGHELQLGLAVSGFANIDNRFLRALDLEVERIKNNINDVRGIRLGPTSDLGLIASPYGCGVEQMANYTETDDFKILRSLDIWEALQETDKAAWFVHEALYRLYRKLAISGIPHSEFVAEQPFHRGLSLVS